MIFSSIPNLGSITSRFSGKWARAHPPEETRGEGPERSAEIEPSHVLIICTPILLLFNIISKAADHLLRIISSMESKYVENNNNNK